MDNDKVHLLLESVIKNENMNNVDIKIKDADVEIADGLMSQILRVTITNSEKKLSLVVKVAPTEPEYRKIVKLLFQCEIFFYDVVMPHFNDLQMKHTGETVGFIPKFYKAVKEDCEEVIIMQDLSPEGYEMLDRRFEFSDDCLRTIMRAFGKFHALSFGLQKENPKVWESLENGVDQNEVFTGEVIDWFCDALKKASEIFKPINKQICEKLMFLNDNFGLEMRRLMRPSAKYPSVIVHMDPWCNNFLFKMKADGSVADVVLIDFQQAEKASPVLDIACFLYMNASVHIIDNFKDMLKVYHDSLTMHGKALGCDIGEVYSWDMFLDDWHEYSRYGLLKSIMGISLNTQELEDVKPLDRNNIGASFIIENWNMKTVERIKGLIVHADKEDFL